jgi:hypothetical protein
MVRGIATLAVCVLAVAALGSVENPITRPFQVHGVLTVTTDKDGQSVFQIVGEGTHMGRFTTYVSGLDSYGLYMTSAAANGDQVVLVMPWVPTQWHLEICGGTGCFQDATGGANVIYESEHVFTTDQSGNTVETWTQKSDGMITY